MRSKFFLDMSISTLQAFLNQLSGVIVFLIISKYLDKSGVGYINWTLALLIVIFSILGFGMENIAVQKAATGNNPRVLLESYLFHVMIIGLVFLSLSWSIQYIIPGFKENGRLFFLLSLSQCLSFFAIPYRQIVNGLQKFGMLFVMSSLGNCIKITGIFLLAVFDRVSVVTVIYVYVLASLLELVLSIVLYKIKLGLVVLPKYNRERYRAFIREGLPQVGIHFFNAAIQRMDWILLGILSTTLMVAEYSVTNRLFELAMLPLVIIAPVIFPRIAKLFEPGSRLPDEWKMRELTTLIRLELVLSAFVIVVVNSCWTDIVDLLTANKYGNSTRQIIFIMSFAMPVLYINNIFWSILFARQQMRDLFYIFLATLISMVTVDLFLIPIYQAKGAAVGYVTAVCVQCIFYFRKVQIVEIRNSVLHIFPVAVSALAAGFLSAWLVDFFVWRILIASGCYFFMLIISGQIGAADWRAVKKTMMAHQPN